VATTLKLTPELKERVAKIVEGTGQSAHAFMVDAIKNQIESAEKRLAFTRDALAAREEFDRTGSGYAMEDVHAYVALRAHGKKAPTPKLKRWRA
jgi:predicted transcriptional regulator